MAWRKLVLEAERSCDDAVLGRSEATAYANQLVGLAKRLSMTKGSPLLAMANRADLAARVGAVLDSRQRRGRAGKFQVALACGAAVVLVLTMSPLTIVAAPQAAGADAKAAPPPRFSATTGLVIANVIVPDLNGKNIEGLRFSDFAVTEDGVAQSIEVFEFQKLTGASKGPQDSVSSYYIVGYYTTNQNVDGKYRKIQITRKGDTLARLNYRNGYYADRFGGVAQGSVDPNTALDPTLPVLIYTKPPQYSEEARKAKWQGTATLSVDVDAFGEPTNIQVLRGLGLGLDQKAIDAVKQWRFRPGTKDGKPVTMQAQVDVIFRLL